MRLQILATIAILSGTASLAGGMDGPETPLAPTPPASAPAVTDFSGAYGGLGFGTVQGEFGSGGRDDDFDFNDGTSVSVFGGYNLQNGNIVYGGEIAYHNNSDFFVVPGFGNDDVIDSMIDLRGRIGYVVGDAMVYGAVGYSFGDYEEPYGFLAEMSGPSVGIGADYKVTENLFVGGDYTMRMLEGEGGEFDLDTAANVSTFTLRVGYSF